jgi:hypothetical protein
MVRKFIAHPLASFGAVGAWLPFPAVGLFFSFPGSCCFSILLGSCQWLVSHSLLIDLFCLASHFMHIAQSAFNHNPIRVIRVI